MSGLFGLFSSDDDADAQLETSSGEMANDRAIPDTEKVEHIIRIWSRLLQ
jgi:hypothetical protein